MFIKVFVVILVIITSILLLLMAIGSTVRARKK
ncbi:hypothetical protein C7457_1477 [Thermovibrio guaymasensis]|uniref:Uncharacterized protein n=1 Tax=Thermovibrio guaymasensis TaxID=240167 RepID=A0A420W653_9BACT|nr:hypothetical protein C7457_1477 [Thermovibrio guaymasensis]